MLSGLSLSEVSHIAILAILIYPSDLKNIDAYDFEIAEFIAPKLAPPAPQQKPVKSRAEGFRRKILQGTPGTSKSEMAKSSSIFGVPLQQCLERAQASLSMAVGNKTEFTD